MPQSRHNKSQKCGHILRGTLRLRPIDESQHPVVLEPVVYLDIPHRCVGSKRCPRQQRNHLDYAYAVEVLLGKDRSGIVVISKLDFLSGVTEATCDETCLNDHKPWKIGEDDRNIRKVQVNISVENIVLAELLTQHRIGWTVLIAHNRYHDAEQALCKSFKCW